MTKPVSNEELSALLDGELSTERTSEVHQALVADAALRTEYERLAKLDSDWSAEASQARFDPAISLQPRAEMNGLSFGTWAIMLALLIAIRLIAKWPDSISLAVIIHAIALGILIIFVIRMVIQAEYLPESEESRRLGLGQF